MRGARRAVGVLALVAGCGGEAAPPVPDRTSRDTAYRWLKLDRPTETLRFREEPLVARDSAPMGECVPLADGGLLASFEIAPRDFEGLSCLVELRTEGKELHPRSVGLFFGFCEGFWWVENLTGSVTVDASDPSLVLFDVDLAGSYSDAWQHEFRQVFQVRTASDSAKLRSMFEAWGDAVALAQVPR